MTIYIVTVTAPGGIRYFDSVWVKQENADKRERQMRSEFMRSGFDINNPAYNYQPSQWATKVVTAEACDGAIQDEPEAPSIPISDLKKDGKAFRMEKK